MQKIIRDYYEQLYANKMDNLEETDKFLEIDNLPRLDQEEIKNMNRPVTSNKTELTINKFPKNRSSRPDEFYQIVRK